MKMKTKMQNHTDKSEEFESTYALLVRSEEKERGVSESAVYLLIMLSAIFSIWQVAQQPIELPVGGVIHTSAIAASARAGLARS